MQNPNKVKFADVSPETREKVKIFLSTLKIEGCTRNGDRIKTLEDALLYAVEQAELVPVLEAKNALLEKRVRELEKQLVEDRAMRG